MAKEGIVSEEDLTKNVAKTEQPAGGGGGGGGGSGGGGSSATKLHIRTFSEFKSKIRELENEEKSPSSTQKLECPEVPQRLREGAKVYYEPQVMSFGPYHHGKSNLQAGETLKLKLAATYFGLSSDQSRDEIYNTISHDIEGLKKFYNPKSTKDYTNEELSVMLLMDGCALLCYILCVCLSGYFRHEEYGIRYQDLSRIHQDALLLENQLPYQLLKYLMPIFFAGYWTVIFQEFFGMSTAESFFLEIFGIKEELFLPKMRNYCCRLFQFLPIIKNFNRNLNPKPEKKSKPCPHLLDLYRKNFLGDERSYPTHSETENGKKGTGLVGDAEEQVMPSFRNVNELMTAGIRIKRSPTRHLRNISIHSNGITACLRIPPIAIDSSTKTLFLNLIAYKISSDVPHDFISYLRFLDSLIDHTDDVKKLQSAGVLQNYLGTHEQVAEFFNTVSSNLESNFHAYKDVRVKIRKHLKSHYNSKVKCGSHNASTPTSVAHGLSLLGLLLLWPYSLLLSRLTLQSSIRPN